MDEEQRARLLDEAVDANEEAILEQLKVFGGSSDDEERHEAFGRIARIIARYCEEQGWEDAGREVTVGEMRSALNRKTDRNVAAVDQLQAAQDDMTRLEEIVGKASFKPPEDQQLYETLAEMERRGELSEENKREIAGIFERLD